MCPCRCSRGTSAWRGTAPWKLLQAASNESGEDGRVVSGTTVWTATGAVLSKRTNVAVEKSGCGSCSTSDETDHGRLPRCLSTRCRPRELGLTWTVTWPGLLLVCGQGEGVYRGCEAAWLHVQPSRSRRGWSGGGHQYSGR